MSFGQNPRRSAPVRRLCLLLALIMACMVFAGSGLSVNAAKNQSTAIALGIDVSKYQGNINWPAVRAAGVTFAFIRVGTSNSLDPYFDKNMREAAAAGIKTGVYIYSHATTLEEVTQDANAVLALIAPYTVNMPVVIDVETKAQKNMGAANLAAMVSQFCAIIESRGYYPMVYSSTSWYNLRIGPIGYDKWVAQWNTACERDDASFWQASCTGRVAGITGDVDVDYQFKDLSSQIISDGFVFRKGYHYFYQNYHQQSNRFVDWQGARYYVDPAGRMYAGGFANLGGYIFCFEADGKMVTGWKEIAGNRYYFGTDGKMATGLQKIGGQTFLFAENGVMYSGWFNSGEGIYHFYGDGHMATGLSDIGTDKYMFDAEGRMKTGWMDMNGARFCFDPNSGKMLRGGKAAVGDGVFAFGANGALITGLVTEGNDTYYYDPAKGGAMATGITEINGNSFFFDGSGKLTKGVVSSGEDTWYFSPDSGVMVKGPARIGDKVYYFDPDTGRMVKNKVVNVGGVDYTLGPDGAVIF